MCQRPVRAAALDGILENHVAGRGKHAFLLSPAARLDPPGKYGIDGSYSIGHPGFAHGSLYLRSGSALVLGPHRPDRRAAAFPECVPYRLLARSAELFPS